MVLGRAIAYFTLIKIGGALFYSLSLYILSEPNSQLSHSLFFCGVALLKLYVPRMFGDLLAGI